MSLCDDAIVQMKHTSRGSFQAFCIRKNMKTIFTICCLVVAATHAQQHQITHFQTSDGVIAWTNPDTNRYYGIEFATNLHSRSWIRPYTPSALNIRSANSQISVEIHDSMFEGYDAMYFRIVSSADPLPPKYYPSSIFHNVIGTNNYWTLSAGALTLNDVSRVFLTGQTIQGEFELTSGEIHPYGYQHWVSPTDYLFDQQPAFPAEFFIHMVSGSKTNTDTVLVSNYFTFDDSLRNL